RFVERVAAYTLTPPGMVLRMAMSVEEALLPRPPRRICTITAAGLAALEDAGSGQKLTAARRRVLQALRDEGACSTAELARRAGFGAAPAEWHSDVSQSARRDTWRAVAGGRARVVVGARSALFLPFAELGLIIVDEEHDASYKQEDGVCYQARDMAVLRASIAELPIVLVSATPSLETVV